MIRRSNLFYGCVTVSIAVLGAILIYGIRHSFSVFFPLILADFGWNRGSTSIMLSLNICIYGFLAPLAGSFGDRWKPKVVMPLGVTVLALATAGCAFAHKLWHFYLLFGILMPIGTAFGGWPLLAPALVNWFARRRALVIGIGQMGLGLSFVYGMYAQFTIVQLGWRYAFLVLAGTLIVLLLPLYVCFFHYRPENIGLKAYGISDSGVGKDSGSKVMAFKEREFGHWTLIRAMRTYQLWLLVLSYFLYWGIGSYLVLAHQVKFAEEAGYSSMISVSVFALFGVFMVLGQLSASVSDWIGREQTVAIAVSLAVIALIALAFVKDTSQTWLLYVYSVCFGYGAGLYSPTIYAGAADLFYGRDFGAITGLLLLGLGTGGAIGPWLGGYFYDISGSYIVSFFVCMVCFGLSFICFLIAAPRNAADLRVKSHKMTKNMPHFSEI